MKSSFAHLERYRSPGTGLLSMPTAKGERWGLFRIPAGKVELRVICDTIILDDVPTWDHVSAHALDTYGQRCPTWEEMCHLKKLFWDDEECVVQFHPAKSEYVNCHPYALHLWKYYLAPFPIPPKEAVGPS